MLPRGYVFIGLNVVRALSVIALILVFCSSILVMVKDVDAVNNFQSVKQSGNSTEDLLNCDYIEDSTVPNQAAGIFWAIVNRLLIIFQVIALFLSELGLFSGFFAKWFPVLGRDFGLGALGIFQCLLGAAILSHHVDDFTLVAAFFLFSLGCVNMLLGLIFRQSAKEKRSLAFWKSDPKNILPSVKGDIPSIPAFKTGSSSYSQRSFMSEKSSFDEKAGFGFGRAGERAAGLKGFTISKPLEAQTHRTGESMFRDVPNYIHRI